MKWFRQERFVKDVVVCEGGGKSQVVFGIWPASDELEVHIDVFVPAKLKRICACGPRGFTNGWLLYTGSLDVRAVMVTTNTKNHKEHNVEFNY